MPLISVLSDEMKKFQKYYQEYDELSTTYSDEKRLNLIGAMNNSLTDMIVKEPDEVLKHDSIGKFFSKTVTQTYEELSELEYMKHGEYQPIHQMMLLYLRASACKLWIMMEQLLLSMTCSDELNEILSYYYPHLLIDDISSLIAFKHDKRQSKCEVFEEKSKFKLISILLGCVGQVNELQSHISHRFFNRSFNQLITALQVYLTSELIIDKFELKKTGENFSNFGNVFYKMYVHHWSSISVNYMKDLNDDVDSLQFQALNEIMLTDIAPVQALYFYSKNYSKETKNIRQLLSYVSQNYNPHDNSMEKEKERANIPNKLNIEIFNEKDEIGNLKTFPLTPLFFHSIQKIVNCQVFRLLNLLSMRKKSLLAHDYIYSLDHEIQTSFYQLYIETLLLINSTEILFNMEKADDKLSSIELSDYLLNDAEILLNNFSLLSMKMTKWTCDDHIDKYPMMTKYLHRLESIGDLWLAYIFSCNFFIKESKFLLIFLMQKVQTSLVKIGNKFLQIFLDDSPRYCSTFWRKFFQFLVNFHELYISKVSQVKMDDIVNSKLNDGDIGNNEEVDKFLNFLIEQQKKVEGYVEVRLTNILKLMVNTNVNRRKNNFFDFFNETDEN
ncbi:hypothetical protein SNEBB_007080 [Seison nebaliae]|nr:hypothetical protein SNEBB_007080 [Seison nebaliae]